MAPGHKGGLGYGVEGFGFRVSGLMRGAFWREWRWGIREWGLGSLKFLRTSGTRRCDHAQETQQGEMQTKERWYVDRAFHSCERTTSEYIRLLQNTAMPAMFASLFPQGLRRLSTLKRHESLRAAPRTYSNLPTRTLDDLAQIA